MRQFLHAGATTLAILSSVCLATGQTTPSRAPGTVRVDLTPTQEQMVTQGLAGSPAQPVPAGVQPQVGSQLPDSMTARSLPSNVTNQVPEAKDLLFVKLPDRIVLIDPDSKLVTEIFMAGATTGSSPARPAQ